MRIYIDESGSFVVPATQEHAFSLVLALIVPSANERELLYEFVRLRDQWPVRAIEIKGSSLNESQTANLIDLAHRYNVLVEFVTLNMGMHTSDGVTEFKTRQADAVTAHITRDHHPDMVRQLEGLAGSMRKMSNQLFVQAFLTIQLVLETIQTATLYFAQRMPSELGDVVWTIDQKDHTITQMEEMWTTLILPMSQSHYVKKPLIILKEGDYSYFARYETAADALDEEMIHHLKWMKDTYGVQEPVGKSVLDPKRLLTEQQTFADSRDLLGLQLADMLASILSRALNDRLQRPGWNDYGKLIVEKIRGSSPFVQLGGAVDLDLPPKATAVWFALKAQCQPLLAAKPRV